MPRPKLITKGGGKRWGLEVQGVAELTAAIRDLMDDMGVNDANLVRSRANQIVGGAGELIRDRARSNARAAGWPPQVVDAIFNYADLTKTGKGLPRKTRAALVGVRTGARPHLELHTRQKRGLFVEWYPGKSKSKRAKSLMLPGTTSSKGPAFGLQKIGMSLARIFESGTSKMRARPAFRPAVIAMRSPALQHITAGYREIIAEHNQNT